MIQLKNITVTHKKDLRPLLQDLSFILAPGDRAVIIGEEGNGKSTLLKLIYDPSLVEDYAEWSGEIITRDKLGFLFQEMPAVHRNKPVWEYFAELPDFYDIPARELAGTARSLGLPSDICFSDQIISTLSGGEKVKLQLLRILLEKPDALLLDEPSNDIDIDTLRWLEEFILSCPLPILFVSHDETLIERTANVILHLELVRRKTLPRHTTAKVPYRQYMAERTASLAYQTQQARKEQSDYERQMEKYRQIMQKVEHQQNIISRADPGGARLLKKKMHAVKSMGRRFEREKENMTELPDVEEAIMLRFPESTAFPAGKRLIDFSLDTLETDRVLARDIRLTVTGPEKLCIIGRNGAGKTTLLKKIADELLTRTDLKAAYMPQDYEELLRNAGTPVDFLCKTGHKDEISKVRTFLGSVKYTPEEMDHPVHEMSGGQKAKLLFLKMILDGCNVLILDEPTRNFSPLSNPVIREVLCAFEGAIISVSHDRKYISEVCDRVVELTENGLREVEWDSEA
ncbi:MAG: ABC-F family ATP-binding cassette domain-containing protein [Oscillospiraceae bacterium]|nr:ABC-F family ATP-binding cassette domain-containing protein [Oscillospiraceae bacterium]